MWLRASYTVENAVITPLFMLIIIVVMRASCDIHDNLIQRSVNSQFVIQTELGGFNDEDTDMYRIKTEEYLKRRVISSKKYGGMRLYILLYLTHNSPMPYYTTVLQKKL